MIKILITAPRGHMDSLIVKAASKNKSIEIVGGLGPSGRDYIGMDIGLAAGLSSTVGASVYQDINEIIEKCDVIVDFSTVELSMEVLKAALKYNKALICGTTGFNSEQERILIEASKKIPLLKAANTSYVVNVMNKLLAEASRDLSDMSDIELIEMHGSSKKDAPSGTAKEMASIIEKAAGGSDIVSFHSIRAGDIPSSHTVIFGCRGERLEITHHAYNWDCYAEGACRAVEYLNEKNPGLYFMEDVINDR